MITANKKTRCALELDGQIVGWLHDVWSGQGNELSFTFGAEGNKELYAWAGMFVQHHPRQKHISIFFADLDGELTSVREFDKATITKLEFPPLDAASKEIVRMAMTLSVSTWRDSQPSGKLAGTFQSDAGSVPGSNFRLSIDSLPTDRVHKIKSFTVTRSGYSDLIISLAKDDVQAFEKWRATGKSKTGTLDYLAANQKDVAFRLSFDMLWAARRVRSSKDSRTVDVRMAVSKKVTLKSLMSNELSPSLV